MYGWLPRGKGGDELGDRDGHMCIYVCVYIYIHTCVYIYIYTHTHTPLILCMK